MAPTIKLFLLVLPLFPACAALPAPVLAPQYYAAYETKLILEVGQRKMDSAFDPVEEQTAIGLDLFVYQPNARSGLEVGLGYASDETSKDVAGVPTDFTGTSYELSVGGRLYFDPVFTGGRPYFSGGVTTQYLKREEDPDTGGGSKDSEWAMFAPYFRGGMEWMLGNHLSLGLEYKVVLLSNLFFDIDIGDSKADANYHQAALVIGWDF